MNDLTTKLLHGVKAYLLATRADWSQVSQVDGLPLFYDELAQTLYRGACVALGDYGVPDMEDVMVDVGGGQLMKAATVLALGAAVKQPPPTADVDDHGIGLAGLRDEDQY